MDWKEFGKTIAPMAPTIGSILGGLVPIPMGSTIGSTIGQVLANTFGSDDPEVIANKVQSDPAAADKLQQLESEAAAKWPALAEMAKALFAANADESKSINATMRAELAKGMPWYHWRNLYGYSVAFEATATSWVILYALVFDKTIVKNVIDSFSFFLSWYALRFGLLGYIHNQGSNEKIAAVTGQVPSMVGNIIKAVRNK